MPQSTPFTPDFRALLPLALLYFILCFAAHPQSAIMQGRFIDPDDTMYAVQSLELLDGQGWYDRTEHRMIPPDGVPFHFSRLLEIPYAATIAVLSPLTGRDHAVLLTAAFWPPVFLLGLFIALRQQARLFMPRKWAALTIFTGMLAQGLLFDFMPGHIDHHGFVALLIELCLSLTCVMTLRPQNIFPAAAAGSILALSVSIGLEALPWLLAFSLFIGIWACATPQRAKAGLVFGLSLFVAGAALLALYRPLSQWGMTDLTGYSITYLTLFLGIALSLACVWALRHNPDISQRVVLGGLFAGLMGVGYLSSFPELFAGPYGAVDKRLLDFLLPNIKEAIPLI